MIRSLIDMGVHLVWSRDAPGMSGRSENRLAAV
jgi:hypothetical protein